MISRRDFFSSLDQEGKSEIRDASMAKFWKAHVAGSVNLVPAVVVGSGVFRIRDKRVVDASRNLCRLPPKSRAIMRHARSTRLRVEKRSQAPGCEPGSS